MTERHDHRAELDETLAGDVRDVFAKPRAPDEFTRRLHDAVDAGFLEPVPRRRRWPLILAAAAAACVALALAPRLWRSAPDPDPSGLQMRSADGIPLAVEMSVLAVSAEGAVTDWVHAGDEVTADAWLRFRLQAPPGVHLSLVRSADEGDMDVFYRWPQEGEDASRVSRDGDVWYSLSSLQGEQTFVCVASDKPLDEHSLTGALGGETVGGARIRIERLPLRVMP